MGSRQEDTSVTENVNKADNINKYNKVERDGLVTLTIVISV